MKILDMFQKYKTGYLVIISNLCVLLFLIAGYLNIGTTLILYGVESVIIGFFALLKFIFGKNIRVTENKEGKNISKYKIPFAAKVILVIFFIGHFGGFVSVQFFFTIGIGMSELSHYATENNLDLYLLIFPWLKGILFSGVILFLSHGLSFVVNYVFGEERNNTAPESFLFSPYPRIVIMQLTIIIGGLVSNLFNSNIAIFSIFLVLKTFFDLSAHFRERSRYSLRVN
jgi:hypothetical protein